MSRFKGSGRQDVTAWDRQQKPSMPVTKTTTEDGEEKIAKSEEPIRVDPHRMRKAFKKDALALDRAIGCRCMNVKARFVPPPPDAEEGTISVVTWPHQPMCPIYQSRREAEILNTANGPMTHTAAPVEGSSPHAPSRRGDGGLWVPGVE